MKTSKLGLKEKITTKEIVVRMLLERGDWMFGYELQGKHTKWGFSGVDADTRAHQMFREGGYTSPNNHYTVEHRRKGKYAQFRAFKSPEQASTADREKGHSPKSCPMCIANQANIKAFNNT